MYFKEISYDSVNSSFIKLKERATVMPSLEFVHVLNAYKRVLAEDIIVLTWTALLLGTLI
jgi:hypothetical protein